MLKRRKPDYRKGLCHLAATLAWLAIAPVAASAAPGDVLFDIQNPMPEAADLFGVEVAAANSLIFVMENANNDIEPGRQGAVHVYNGAYGTPGFGLPVSILLDPSSLPDDGLNGGLAADDKVLAVGSILDDTGETGAGAVWLFNIDTGSPNFGNPLRKIVNPGPQAFAKFGIGLELADGRALIGARDHDAAGFEDAGAAYLFDVDPLSPEFGSLLLAFDNPTPEENDFFGETVAFLGTDLLISARQDGTEAARGGTVYLFDGDSGSPTFGQLIHRFINPEPTVGDQFGVAIAVAGTVVAVAASSDDFGAMNAGSVYLFNGSKSSLDFGDHLATIRNPFPDVAERFGWALAVTGGGRLIVGSINDNNVWDLAGSAFLFGSVPGTSEFAQLLLAVHNPEPNFEPIEEQFGAAVAGLGDHMLIGQPGEGNMFFGYQGRAWVIEAPPIPTPPPPTATPQLTSPTPTASASATCTPTPTPGPCCPGDADNSGGLVDAFDFISVQANFGAEAGPGDPGDADCSGGSVNTDDFLTVQAEFGGNCDF